MCSLFGFVADLFSTVRAVGIFSIYHRAAFFTLYLKRCTADPAKVAGFLIGSAAWTDCLSAAHD